MLSVMKELQRTCGYIVEVKNGNSADFLMKFTNSLKFDPQYVRKKISTELKSQFFETAKICNLTTAKLNKLKSDKYPTKWPNKHRM